MRVVIDTNVLVSGLLSPFGPSARILDLVLLGELTPVFDDRILAEYREVLARREFGFDPEDVRQLLHFFEVEGERVTAPPLAVTLPDPDDLPFLETAVAAGADALITGKIALEKPSPNKIIEQLVTGPSKATFYRRIHELAAKMPEHVMNILGRLQEGPAMAMKPQGVISIDEHIIPHSSKKIEGVGYFYSTTRGDVALGMSLISSHYFGDNLEYPLLHDFFRKQDELEASGMADQYRPKNQVVRDMIEKLCSFSTCPDLFLFDSSTDCRRAFEAGFQKQHT